MRWCAYAKAPGVCHKSLACIYAQNASIHNNNYVCVKRGGVDLIAIKKAPSSKHGNLTERLWQTQQRARD
jgi:hypothetical protein